MIFTLYTTHKTQPGILLTNSTTTTTMSTQTIIITYCKVCHDAGNSDFNNHWLMDKVGNITCPYLLSLKCNRCSQKGHTQKYCTTGRGVSTTTPRKPRIDDTTTPCIDDTTTSRDALTTTTTRNNNMFCGFCFNFDKNDQSYKTHYVRKDKNDLNSDVTCPRLLATECKFCHQLGHTPNNCQKIHPDDRLYYNTVLLNSFSEDKIRDLIEEEIEKYDFWHMEMVTGFYSKEIDRAAKRAHCARSRSLQLKKLLQDRFPHIQKHFDKYSTDTHHYNVESNTPQTQTETNTETVSTPKKTTWAKLATAKKIPYAPIPLTRCFTTFGITPLPLQLSTTDLPLTTPLPLTPASPTVSKSWADYDD